MPERRLRESGDWLGDDKKDEEPPEDHSGGSLIAYSVSAGVRLP
jgi:hypothetical protein